MKKTLSLLVTLVMILSLGAFALAESETPAAPETEAVEQITPEEEAAIVAKRHADALEAYKAQLDKAVAAGKLTQEKADEMYVKMEEALAKCDGTNCPICKRAAKQEARANKTDKNKKHESFKADRRNKAERSDKQQPNTRGNRKGNAKTNPGCNNCGCAGKAGN